MLTNHVCSSSFWARGILKSLLSSSFGCCGGVRVALVWLLPPCAIAADDPWWYASVAYFGGGGEEKLVGLHAG